MPLVFRHGAAGAAFTAAVAAWLVFELVMRVRQRLRARGPAARDPSAFILVPSLAAAIIAAQALGRRGQLPWPGGLLWPVVAGMVLIAAGVGLRAWSILSSVAAVIVAVRPPVPADLPDLQRYRDQ